MSELPTQMRAERFSNSRALNLKSMGNGKGVRHLTIRNIGEINLIIADSAREIIAPGETFVINSPLLVTNQRLELEFDNNPDNKPQEAIIRYLIDSVNS